MSGFVSAYATGVNAEAVALLDGETQSTPSRLFEAVKVTYSYDQALASAKALLIKNGSTTVLSVDLPVGFIGAQQLDLTGILSDRGEDLSATLPAGGTGITGKVTLTAFNRA